MRFRFIPREQSFFNLFEQMANKVQEGAEELLDLLKNYSDLERKSARIVFIEHEGDDITHEVIRRLNTTFITPFDREDIHRLATSLDDVLDHVEAAAEYLVLHKIEQPLPQMVAQAETLAEAARVGAEAMPSLKHMGKPRKGEKSLDSYCVEVNRLENEGDHLYRRTIAELFSGEFNAMDVLKWKDIIEEIETAIDRLEDVANTIEGIVLKQT